MIRAIGQIVLVTVLASGLAYQSVLLWELWSEPNLVSSMTKAAQPPYATKSVEVPPQLSHYPLDKYKQTLERPLFVEGRRPPKPVLAAHAQTVTPAAPPAPPPYIALDRYRLLGVLLDDASRRAFIQTPSGARTWVSQGEKIEEWAVIEIQSDRAVLSLRDRRGELRLYPVAQGH